MAPRLHFPDAMNHVLRKIGDFTLSLTAIVLLAMLVVFIAGHMPTIGY